MPTVKKYREYVREYKKKNCPPYSNKKKDALKKIAVFLDYKGPTTPDVTVKDYKDYIRAYKKKNCLPFSKLEKSKLRELAISYGYKATDGKTKKVTKREPRKRKPEVKRQTKPPKPKPEVKKPEVKPPKKKLTAGERYWNKERTALFNKQEPFYDVAIPMWRKADKLVWNWFNNIYIPTYRRFFGPFLHAETYEEQQKIYNDWLEAREKIVSEFRSQWEPLREAYYKIENDNKELNLNLNSFPTPFFRISKYDNNFRRYLLKPEPKPEVKKPAPKPEPEPTPGVELIFRSRKPRPAPKPKQQMKPEPKPSAEKKTLDSALSSIVEKARALIKYWDRKKVYPAFRRSVLNPMKRDENRFNKEQSIIRYYKVWEKRKIKFKREIESQLKPLRDSYDEIYRKNEGLNLRHYEFPTFVKEFRKLDTYIESVMHPAKFAAPKPKQQMKIQQTKPEVTPEVKTESEPITRRGRLEKIFGHYTADQELDADRDIAKTLAKQEYKNKTLLERSHPDIVIKKLASHAYKFGVFDTEGRVARDFTKFQQYMKRYPDFKSLTMMRIPEKKAVSILIQYVDPKNEYSGIKIRKYIYKGQGDYKFIPGTPKHMQDF